MRHSLPIVLATLLVATTPLPLPSQAQAVTQGVTQGVRLVMVDLKGCGFCAAFKREVLPTYAASREGHAAPLSIVQIDGPWPDGIALAGRPRVTPTFILLRAGIEQARIEGYASPATFWPGLRGMLNDAGSPP